MGCHLLKDCRLQLSLSCIINDIWAMSTRSQSWTQNMKMPSLYSECPSSHYPIALSSFTANLRDLKDWPAAQNATSLPYIFSPTYFIPTSTPTNLVKTPVISLLCRQAQWSFLYFYNIWPLSSIRYWRLLLRTWVLITSSISHSDGFLSWPLFLRLLWLLLPPFSLHSRLRLFSMCTLSQGNLLQPHLLVRDS